MLQIVLSDTNPLTRCNHGSLFTLTMGKRVNLIARSFPLNLQVYSRWRYMQIYLVVDWWHRYMQIYLVMDWWCRYMQIYLLVIGGVGTCKYI